MLECLSSGPSPAETQASNQLKDATPARRYLAVWFPFLSTDRARILQASRSCELDDAPFVLVENQGGSLRLVAADRSAISLGLKIGMRLAAARSTVPRLIVGEFDPEADRRFLRRCSAACEFFTPLVALDSPEGLLLDITGCGHLFGGERDLCERLRRRLSQKGLSLRLAVAGTPDAARALARFGAREIIPPGEDEAAGRRLPITALDLPTETTLALSRAGMRSLDDLMKLPAKTLTARFGANLVARLHRIMGWEDIRITPLRAMPDCLAERHFAEPLGTVPSLLAVLERLAREIALLLERQGRGGRVFKASFFRTDGAVRRLTIETAEAGRDAKSLMRLMTLKIETLADPLDPGFGFDAVRLAVLRSEPIAEKEKRLEPDATIGNDEDEVGALIDRLVTRFGRERVMRFVAHDTHDPSRAAETLPVLLQKRSAPFPAPEPGEPPLRPLTLFDPPQLIEALAEVPDGPPLKFRWRRVLHEIARAEGPERIAPEWWRDGGHAPETRDYYRIEDGEGHRFWVFREGLYEDSTSRPRWFLHGLFS